VAMTLADVLPAIQQGTIDGALAAMTVYTTMHYWDASKYVTETGQPFIFSMAFLSKKWFDALPKDLQTILDTDAGKAAAEINPWEEAFYARQREIWAQHGELISLGAGEQAAMMKLLSGVGEDVTRGNPELHQAYSAFVEAVKRTK
jgi:TRAP-type transport system periplasmic protein